MDKGYVNLNTSPTSTANTRGEYLAKTERMRDAMPNYVSWERNRRGRKAARRQYEDEGYVAPRDVVRLSRAERMVPGQHMGEQSVFEDDQRPRRK